MMLPMESVKTKPKVLIRKIRDFEIKTLVVFRNKYFVRFPTCFHKNYPLYIDRIVYSVALNITTIELVSAIWR